MHLFALFVAYCDISIYMFRPLILPSSELMWPDYWLKHVGENIKIKLNRWN